MPADQSSSQAIFDRLVAAEFSSLKRLAPEIVEFEHGWAALNPSLPLVWDANFVAVTDPEATSAQVAGAADEILGLRGLAHRCIYVCHTDLEAGERLVDGLTELDRRWETGSEVYMVLSGKTKKHPEEVGREVTGDELLEARSELVVESAGEHHSEESRRQLLDYEERSAEALECGWFAAGDPPEGFCQLLDHGNGIAQVEHVGTMRHSRGKGLASAAVLKAAEESKRRGDEILYVVADADDWPQHLYGKLGFAATGRLPSATLKPPPTSAGTH